MKLKVGILVLDRTQTRMGVCIWEIAKIIQLSSTNFSWHTILSDDFSTVALALLFVVICAVQNLQQQHQRKDANTVTKMSLISISMSAETSYDSCEATGQPSNSQVDNGALLPLAVGYVHTHVNSYRCTMSLRHPQLSPYSPVKKTKKDHFSSSFSHAFPPHVLARESGLAMIVMV